MASHRKPLQRALTGSTARAALTLALTAAATAVTAAAAQPGHAAAAPGPRQAQAEVGDLYRQAEQATQRYDGARERADAARRRVADLQDQLARRTERINETREHLGSLAAGRYRTGGIDPAVQLILSDRPDQYLESAGLLDRMDGKEAAALRGLVTQQRQARRLRDEAAGQLGALAADERELAAAKRTVTAKLERAGALLRRIAPAPRPQSPPQPQPQAQPGEAGEAGDDVPLLRTLTARALNPRAGEAVAFALAQLGKPYAWGATGPGSYDCSGLVQAAWQAAGIALPRTTYSQINAGQRVPRSALEPGDLVFFYSGVSHVGLYIGGGRMIHAPHPGAPVRVAPISEMPFAGATRPV